MDVEYIGGNANVRIHSDTGTADLILDSDTSYDPRILFREAGTIKFTMGVDGSDADKFKIGTSAVSTDTRLTIDSSGNVGIATTAPSTKFHVYGTADATLADSSGLMVIGHIDSLNVVYDGNEIQARNNAAASNIYIQNDGGVVYFGGNVYADAFYYNSDVRLKKDIENLGISSIEKILELNPVQFKWKKNDELNLGFIAQDLEKIFPELVSTNEDKEELKSINYSGLIAPLVKTVQEQQVMIEELREEIKLIKIEVYEN